MLRVPIEEGRCRDESALSKEKNLWKMTNAGENATKPSVETTILVRQPTRDAAAYVQPEFSTRYDALKTLVYLNGFRNPYN